MRNIKTIILFLACISLVSITFGVGPVRNNSGNNKGVRNVTAGCAPGNSKAYLDLNNVRTNITTKGSAWQDSGAGYFIPKSGGKTSIFAGGIWVAGVDVNGQLRVAARTFVTAGEDDYWPGPLIARGSNLANVSPEVCNQFDRLWKVDRDMVTKYRAWYAADAETRERDYPGYQPPVVLQEWPGNGPDFDSEDSEYDQFLAPFFDSDGDYVYNLSAGDYPNYEVDNTNSCKFVPERLASNLVPSSVTLYGDQTIWWVYNDKGNIHSESQGSAIGMEIRGQAFAFSTNDELNNMTFYNYQLINRSTFTLNNAYFGVWVDADVGDYLDDRVGCDINRGLSFAYNGDNQDGDGSDPTYGVNPPAVGFDFFEGPYMDADGMDEPSNWPGRGEVVPDCQNGYEDSLDIHGNFVLRRRSIQPGDPFNGNINGLNFGDRIANNERWGMRRFVYHENKSGSATGDPSIAIDYYNYLQGIWLDNVKMTYGGDGHSGTIPSDFMFPWKSDECNWGTEGTDPNETDPNGWRMTDQMDGRLLQSAGPFKLLPGATNYITIGVPWARTNQQNAIHSVELLKLADDKCQKLFENCFRMIEGPNAPDLTAIEMDGKFIIHLSNPAASNNYLEGYVEIDPFLPGNIPAEDRKYRFQGYQVYQLKNKDVTVNQIYDEDMSKLVYQCDIEDNVSQLVNFTWNSEANANSFQIMVQGENKGIRHSFELLYDKFAKTSNNRLINYKSYYYIVIAYAYNNFKTYNQNDPEALDGQKITYLPSRKSAEGEIRKYELIPRPAQLGDGGITPNSEYGDSPSIIYHDGRGNGDSFINLTQDCIDQIMTPGANRVPWKVSPRVYEQNAGPIKVTVVDPLNVVDGDYILKMEPDSVRYDSLGGVNGIDYIYTTEGLKNVDNNGLILNTMWTLIRNGSETLRSPVWTRYAHEYIIPQYGIAINLYQVGYPVVTPSTLRDLTKKDNGFVGSSISFQNPMNPWLSGLPDLDGQIPFNWIRCGSYVSEGYNDVPGDSAQVYEKVVNGTWAPYKFASAERFGPGNPSVAPSTIGFQQFRLPSIDVVITKDSSKWTRCIVIETCENTTNSSGPVFPNPVAEGGARKFMLRQGLSLNKLGQRADSITQEASTNPNDPNYISAYGMSWFPGYAIDVETGERLNIAFGEDSYQVGENGRDMLWNPTSSISSVDGVPSFGGKHFIYVFSSGYGHTSVRPFPRYDEGRKLFSRFHRVGTESVNTVLTRIGQAMLNAAWVNIPLISFQNQFRSYAQMPDNEVTIKIRVGDPYHQNIGPYLDTVENKINKGYPYFTFSMDNLAAVRNNRPVLVDALENINVVPNPYYAHNAYEKAQLDNVVKITNLPKDCTVKIFNISGTLIREFSKSSNQTWIDWNLTNTADIPIAGGVYIIHVSVPNVGEKTLKWFGILRPADLSNF